MTKQATKGVNILQSPEERKKFKKSVEDIAAQMQLIADRRETIKEMISELSDMYGVKTARIREWANYVFKGNFAEQQEQIEQSNELFDIIFNNRTDSTKFIDLMDEEGDLGED